MPIEIQAQSKTPNGLVIAYAIGPGPGSESINLPDIIDACKTGPLKLALQRASKQVSLLNALLLSGVLVLTVTPGAGLASYNVLFEFNTPDFQLTINTSDAQTGLINLRYQHTLPR